MLAPSCKLVRDTSDQLCVPRSTPILCTLSKSDRMVLIMRSPFGYTPVQPECPEMLSSSGLLIKMWQLTKAYGVTRNELKIHVICYITLLCRGVGPPPNECPRYDTKQSDGEVPVLLEHWVMQSKSLLPLHPGPLWPGVVAPDRVLSMGQIELTAYWIVWIRTFWLNWIVWNRNVF